jgi:Uma2 family endonuclease
MSTMSVQPHVTFDEFLALEEAAEEKHELIGGIIYAMAGASRRHNEIVANLMLTIGPEARKHSCRGLAADQLVRVDDLNGKYPDFGVYCEPETHAIYASTPCLLAEVLSPSSHERDKILKLVVYKRIESLRAYLIVDPVSRSVLAHLRDDRGRWTALTCSETDVLTLPCPYMLLSISDLFV